MSSARKKVIVRMLSGEVHRGYLPASGFGADEETDLLLPDGRAISLALSKVKYVAYVKEFNLANRLDPEQIGPRSFASKPRSPGLWVRLRFADEESLEGIVHGGIGFLHSLRLDDGLFLEPPDKRGNTQRLFIPRAALNGFEVLGASGIPAPKRRGQQAPPEHRQGGLFEPPTDGE